jgi:hypothetical protein
MQLRRANSKSDGILFVISIDYSCDPGLSRKWADHAAFAERCSAEETGANRWPSPEPSAPL